jgi:hypothetical protein
MNAECVAPVGSWSADRPMFATALPALTLMYHSAESPSMRLAVVVITSSMVAVPPPKSSSREVICKA